MRCIIPNLLKNAGVIFLLVGIAGCGFHLRGSVQLPTALSVMTVMDARPATEIASQLRRSLERQGVTLREDASMVLLFQGESFTKRVLSVDTQGRAQEYGLSYQVSFSLRDTQGELWLSVQNVGANRDMRVDPAAVLAAGSEEARLKMDMINDAVNNILRRLQNARPPAGLSSSDQAPAK